MCKHIDILIGVFSYFCQFHIQSNLLGTLPVDGIKFSPAFFLIVPLLGYQLFHLHMEYDFCGSWFAFSVGGCRWYDGIGPVIDVQLYIPSACIGTY